MKPVDFSCKHDILILNDDGTYNRMDEPYFKERKIAPGTWRIESDGDYAFLLEGDERAICIDTGYGCGDIRAFCQSLTEKPLTEVMNSHFHFDHTANNYLFDNCYMTKETAQLGMIPFKSFDGVNFPDRDTIKKTIIKQGDIIDLGNRPIEIFEMHGHAPGGTLFLDRRERILFSGDEVGPMRGANNDSVEELAEQIRNILSYKGEYDCIWAAFGNDAFPISLLEDMLGCCEDILAGKEGEKSGGHRPNRPQPVDPEGLGRTVYLRRRPRGGDGGRPQSPDGREPDIRAMKHGAATLTYDTANIRKK